MMRSSSALAVVVLALIQQFPRAVAGEEFAIAKGKHAPPLWPDVMWKGDVHDAMKACSSPGDACGADEKALLTFRALLSEGQRQTELSKFQLAQGYYKASIETAPRMAAGWTGLGNLKTHWLVHLCNHQVKKCKGFSRGVGAPALSAYRVALSLHPDSKVLRGRFKQVQKFMKDRLEPSEYTREMKLAKEFSKRLLATEDATQWLQLYEQKPAFEKTGPKVKPEFSMQEGMKLLWASPVSRANIVSSVGGAAKFQKLVAPLLQEVLQGYNAVKDRVAQEYPERAKDANYINDNFFSWQKYQFEKSNWKTITSSKSFERLQQFMLIAFKQFFDSLGIEQQNEVQPKDLYFWFSVGADSAEHGPHFHDDSSAAAVLYLQVPPDAGAITFYDPRAGSMAESTCDAARLQQQQKSQPVQGQEWLWRQYTPVEPAPGSRTSPPFHHPYSITPEGGDIVMFAPWIKHGVSAGKHPDQLRVSMSFNLVGKWEWTSSLVASPAKATDEGAMQVRVAPNAQKIML